MVSKADVQVIIMQLFSKHFCIQAGAFIGSRSTILDNPSPDSDFDCFLIINEPKGHGSEIWIDNTPVHIVLIPKESIEKYLHFDMVRCSWQFLTVLDWLRRGEIFYDPKGLLRQYAHKAAAWFDNNMQSFVLAKVSEIRIQLAKLSSWSTDEDTYISRNFTALYTTVEAVLTLLLCKGKVFHGPKHLIPNLRSINPVLYQSFVSALFLEYIDIKILCSLIETILQDIDESLK